MSENRCPMCSKLNAPEAEECRFCGARIKPLFIGSSDDQAGLTTPEPGSFGPAGLSGGDWSADSPESLTFEDTGSDNAAAKSRTDDNDWMDRMRSEAVVEDESEAESSSGASPEENGENDQWLDALRSKIPDDEPEPDAGDSPGPDQQTDEDEDSDWMLRLRSGVVMPADDDEAWLPVPDDIPMDSQSTGGDSSEQDPDQPDDPFEQMRSTAYAEAPEIFGSSLDDDPGDGESGTGENDPEADWFSGISRIMDQEKPAENELSEPEGPERVGDGAVDWLDGSGLSEEAEADTEAGIPEDDLEPLGVDALPGWLSGVGEEGDQEADWLNTFESPEESAASVEQQSPAVELEPLDAGAVPDWLRGFIDEHDDLPGAEHLTDGPPVSSEEQEPGIDGFGGMPGTGGEELSDETLDEFVPFEDAVGSPRAGETPDWLREAFDPDTDSLLSEEAETRSRLERLEEEPGSPDGLPGWFSSSQKIEAARQPEREVESFSGQGELPVEEGSGLKQEKVKGDPPEWLQNIIKDSKVDVEAELDSMLARSTPADSPTGDLSLPGDAVEAAENNVWFDEAIEGSLSGDADTYDPGLEAAELPDWLQNARTHQEAETGRLAEKTEAGLSDDLAPDSGAPGIGIGDGDIEIPDSVPDLHLKEYAPGQSLRDEDDHEDAFDPSWIDPDTEPKTGQVPDEFIESAEMPDWLSQVQRRQSKETTILSLDDSSIEDQLSELASEKEISPDLTSGTGSITEADEDDILADFSALASRPSWLDDLDTGESDDFESSEKLPEEDASAFSEDSLQLPDWMASLTEDSEGAGELSDRDFRIPDAESLQEFTPGKESESELSSMDWLDDQLEEIELEEEPDPQSELSEAEMPDWLSQVRQRQTKETSFLPPLEEPEEIRDFQPEDPGQTQDEGSTWPPRRLDQREKEELEAGTTDLSDLVQKSPSEDQQPDVFKSPISKPVWLDDLPESPISPSSAPAFVSGSISPDEEKGISDFNLDQKRDSEWLEAIGPDNNEAAASSRGGIDLTRATLPAWLEAMRPVEGAMGLTGDEDDLQSEMEVEGPLAGIQGALSAEPAIASQKRIRSGVNVLGVSDEDHAHADLLSRLIADEETELKPIPRQADKQYRFRLAVGILLILAAFIPSFLGFPDFALPVQEPMDLAPLFSMVDNLPLDEPALIVYDLEAGYFAEMEAVSSPVLYHLLGRKIPVVTLSTDMVGPALADRMIRRVSLPFVPRNGEDYVHLGYLSGGVSGVQLFTLYPQLAGLDGYMIPADLLQPGGGIWSLPMLSGVRSLSDFSVVVVVANDSDRARTWIEQTGPRLGDTPLLMVVSTGLEPAVRPYYEGRDPVVSGMLTGVPAAAAYDLRFQRTGGAEALWGPYNTVSTVVFLILAGCGVVNLVRGIQKRKQKAENDSS